MEETFLGWEKELDSEERTCLTAWRLSGRVTHSEELVEEEDVFLCLNVSPQHLNEQNMSKSVLSPY